jgi:hypothetical protein
MRQWRTARAQLRTIRQVEQERLQQEQQRQRQMALQFERERREQEAQERVLARAAAKQLALQEAERRRLQQQEARRLEAVLQRQAEEKAQRHAQEAVLRRQAEEEALRRQAEEEQLRETGTQRAAAVEAALPSSEEQAPQPVGAAATLESEVAPLESQIAELVAASQPEPELAPVRARRDNRLRPAMAMAAVTSVLLMGALMGYAHRRPASPVPLSVLQRSNVVEQKLPFGPAVIPAASLGAPALTATAAPAPAAAPAPEKHDAQGSFRRVRVGDREVDYVSDDVTVRHFNTPRRGHAVQHPASDSSVNASTRGVKQISDIE